MIACMVRHGTAAFSYCHFSSYFLWISRRATNVRDEPTHPYFNIAAAAGKEDQIRMDITMMKT
jgi:hypothetical protein